MPDTHELKTSQSKCFFCSEEFPDPSLLISGESKHWYLVHSKQPQTKLHCLLVLKPSSMPPEFHVQQLADLTFCPHALTELGILLGKASKALRACSDKIVNVLVVSLNTGVSSKHLHFHLIPVWYGESVKTVANSISDGGGMFFLARKEVVVDTVDSVIQSICGDSADSVKYFILEATYQESIKNVLALRKSYVTIDSE